MIPFVRSAVRVAERVRLNRQAVFHGQLVGSEQSVPQHDADSVVHGVLVPFRSLRRVMPAMNLRRDEHAVEPAGVQARAAVRHEARGRRQTGAEHHGHRIEADEGQEHGREHVAQSEVERMRYERVDRLQVGDAVMVGMQLPQKGTMCCTRWIA